MNKKNDDEIFNINQNNKESNSKIKEKSIKIWNIAKDILFDGHTENKFCVFAKCIIYITSFYLIGLLFYYLLKDPKELSLKEKN